MAQPIEIQRESWTRVVLCLAFALTFLIGVALAIQRPKANDIFVSPTGSDDAPGTAAAPFRTLPQAQRAARQARRQAAGRPVTVHLAAGIYRLHKTLEFGLQDSGRDGDKVVYRSQEGPGKARLLGSRVLVGWQPYGDGIWKVRVPEGFRFHTLYENGRRVWKARFPNHEYLADYPTARGPYLHSADGCRKLEPGRGKLGDAWLVYAPQDAPPVLGGPQLRLAIFDCGKCDWMRCIYRVCGIDPQTRRLTFAVDESPYGQLANESFRVLGDARYFLEDDLGLLDAPGEFFLDEKASALYYKPLGKGHPDSLNIAAPLVDTLLRVQGNGREECVSHLRFEGLSFEETNDFPKTWWNCDYGRTDAALVWLRNCRGVEIQDCRFLNSGRNGVMFIGHNEENRVEGCEIAHMGVNGVTLSNRFLADDGKGPTADCCRANRVTNCRIHDVGEIHCYASCVNVFNASDNEVGHCELFNSVRYAVTLRGNTNAQFVKPHVFINLPKCKGNRFHHLDIHHCGQDSGDMGAVHAANLNIPGGDAVNTFDQVVVADVRACPSMHDLAPDGIFLDWPCKSMHQVFRNFQVLRVPGKPLRSHKPENGDSAVTENVSWKPAFRESAMDYDHIGLTDRFPAAFGAPTPRLGP